MKSSVLALATTVVLLGMLTVACGQRTSTVPLKSTPAVAQIEPFLEPDANQEPVLTVLQSAKKNVLVEMHLLNDKDVMDALIQAHMRGVDVRVILDAQPANVGAGNKPAISEFAGAGISVREGSPASKTMHSKLMVIDDKIALIMTLDQTRAGFLLNRGFGIIDREPDDISEISSVFESDWDRKVPSLSNPNLIWGPEASRSRLLDFIDTAIKTLDIEAAQMQDSDVIGHLIAAVKRGTAVRVIMSPPLSGSDLNAPGRQKLIAAGVQMRQLRIPYIDTTMMVADGMRGFVGSQVFTPLSLDASRELGIMMTQKRTVDGLQGTFKADWEIAR